MCSWLQELCCVWEVMFHSIPHHLKWGLSHSEISNGICDQDHIHCNFMKMITFQDINFILNSVCTILSWHCYLMVFCPCVQSKNLKGIQLLSALVFIYSFLPPGTSQISLHDALAFFIGFQNVVFIFPILCVVIDHLAPGHLQLCSQMFST